MIPKDPMILLSYVNTQLRDFYPSLTEFCKTFDLDEEALRYGVEFFLNCTDLLLPEGGD